MRSQGGRCHWAWFLSSLLPLWAPQGPPAMGKRGAEEAALLPQEAQAEQGQGAAGTVRVAAPRRLPLSWLLLGKHSATRTRSASVQRSPVQALFPLSVLCISLCSLTCHLFSAHLLSVCGFVCLPNICLSVYPHDSNFGPSDLSSPPALASPHELILHVTQSHDHS